MASNELFTSLVSIGTAIVGVAIISVLVSRNAQTPQVINAAGNAFSNALGVAVSPVTGGNTFGGNNLSVQGLDASFH